MTDRTPASPGTTTFDGHEDHPSGETESSLSELLREVEEWNQRTVGNMLQCLIRAVRQHLRMDICFISEFHGDYRTIRFVDAPKDPELLRPGTSDLLESTYCQRVVDGRLPELIHNAQELPEAQALPATRKFGIGSHISVPIKLPDGRLYGTFCCFDFEPIDSLDPRDLAYLRTFADTAGELIHHHAQELSEQQKRLTWIASHDRVSGLPTEEVFLETLDTVIQHAALRGERVHVIVSQHPLDGIAQSLGQEGVNELARTGARRLQEFVGDEYFMARLSTECAGFLPPPSASFEEVSRFAMEMARLLQSPMRIRGEQLQQSVYLGIATYPDDAPSAKALLQVALSAAGAAETPGEPQFYSSEVHTRALHALRMESRLRDALEHDELQAWFQPQFRLQDQKLVGAETLVRWRTTSGEVVSPGEFLPLAERTGLIQAIDTRMIESACQTLARWRSAHPGNQRISINVTPADIRAKGFASWINELSAAHGLPPGALELELTETMMVDIDTEMLDRLRELRTGGLGIRIAIDDFGTGYSSLGYLHKLPADILKIDKSFTAGVPEDRDGTAITRALVGLAREFKLELVAEGIETQSQFEYLKALGVQTGQGFLIGRPMPEDDFLRFVDQWPMGTAP